MIIMFHCDVLSNQNVIGNALMWVKNWDSCPRNGSLVPCSDTLSIIRRYFTGTRTSSACLIIFQGNLDLEQFIEIEKWDGGVHLSLSGQDLKFDQNIGRYYFNFPAPCSLPILFSTAWCNNKCYLDPYLVRGRNGSAGSDDSLIRPAPNNFLALSLRLFIRVWAGAVRAIESGLICLWRWIMRLNMTFSCRAQHGEIFFRMLKFDTV